MSITNNIETRTTGDNDDAVQVFIENTIIDPPVEVTSPFNFEVPLYDLSGASFRYYEQDVSAISTNLNNSKTLMFEFSANTFSFSGITQLSHDIYRFDIEPFSAVIENGTGTTAFEDALSAITTPLVTVLEPVSGASFTATTTHSFEFPERVKPYGQFAQDLLRDKSQFFVNSRFVFPRDIDQTFGEVQTISGDSVVTLYVVPSGATELLTSSGQPHQITGGTFSGITINGAYFTYFSPPHKPDINVINDAPSVVGNLPTFSPIFSFKNVDDGDYYKLQVTYNTGDTAFSGTTTLFKIAMQDGDPEFIRTFSTPLTPNEDFIYRIGNTKEIINLFGIKQNVTTWGEYVAARTANDGQFELSGTVYKNIVGGTTLAGATITLTVQSTISNVDLGVDSTQNPDIFSEVTSPLGGGSGSTITVGPTSSNGTYSFGRINGGTYLVTGSHPSYPPDQTISITITQDTNLDFVFGILWGSIIVTFTDPETFI